jgi:hypothetical protein
MTGPVDRHRLGDLSFVAAVVGVVAAVVAIFAAH